ncbi:hypothetical protein ACQR1W_14775 [Bradyrhizobium sp. HKCCYLS1011]|uniref:hypothetical protein n=1 Tax=Bradyrhizobium sp. HKCCYLS1011 TaxID=3420733 RepID=UPI003EBC5D32
MKAVNPPNAQPDDSSNADALATFVTAQNIELYKARLATEANLSRRRVLLELLAKEFAKLPKSNLPKTLRRVEDMKVDLS